MHQVKVLKFGGSSVATAEQLRRVKNIVLERPGLVRAVVVSARGKDVVRGGAYSVKETDLHIMAFNALTGRPIETDTSNEDARKVVEMLHARGPVSEITFDHIWQLIAEPLREIVAELGHIIDINGLLEESRAAILEKRGLEFTKSRGEWHMAHIVAKLLGMPMVDSADMFRFMQNGRLNEEQTLERIATHCGRHTSSVVPGFYGADIKGDIHTFPRGGSDVSATWVARALGVQVCEIWSDVPGVFMADPKIVNDPDERIVLDYLTYREAREAQVQALHEDAVRPLREMETPIPIHMLDTRQPDQPGTWIVHKRPNNGRRVQIITGHEGYIALNVYKTGYHDQVGGTIDILLVLKIAGVPFHHISTGTDGAMIVVHKSVIKNGTLSRVLADIQANFQPQRLDAPTGREIAVINLVGQMDCSLEVIGRMGMALKQAGILEGRFVDAGGSSGTIVVGVDADKLDDAILALHREFAKDVVVE